MNYVTKELWIWNWDRIKNEKHDAYVIVTYIVNHYNVLTSGYNFDNLIWINDYNSYGSAFTDDREHAEQVFPFFSEWKQVGGPMLHAFIELKQLYKKKNNNNNKVQRKSFLQLAIWTRWS